MKYLKNTISSVDIPNENIIVKNKGGRPKKYPNPLIAYEQQKN